MDSSACSAVDHCPFHRKDLPFFLELDAPGVAVKVSGTQQDVRQGILGFCPDASWWLSLLPSFERVPFHPRKQP